MRSSPDESAPHVGRARFEVTSQPGTYILAVRVYWETVMDIGRIGEHVLEPGLYLYTGSALGPGGLRARLGRHASFSHVPRWHIDYLKNASSPVEAWCHAGRARLEHEWAEALSECDWAESSVPGFGSSDCRCPTHLFITSAEEPYQLFDGMTEAPTFRVDSSMSG